MPPASRFSAPTRDASIDSRSDNAWIAAHHQDGIFRDGQRLRIGRLEIDDQRRLAGVGRRVDPRIDAAAATAAIASSLRQSKASAKRPYISGPGDDRRRKGEHRDGEAQRVRIPRGHARRGRGDANRVDFALKPRPMGRPKSCGARIAVVVGERVGERRGGTVAHLRVAIEPGQDVARRRPAQPHERRKGCSDAESEQDDAADANGPWRELPGARP